MRIALVTTPAGARSGIGDYTRHLLPYLRERAEVELFVDVGCEGEEPDGSRTRPVDELRPKEFDQLLYQLGNERQHDFMLPLLRSLGGTVMLHDWVLFDLALAAHPELERGGLRGLVRAVELGGAAEARIWARNHHGPRPPLSTGAPAGLGSGWHASEPSGRWTAPTATLRTGGAKGLRVEVGAVAGTSLRLAQSRRGLLELEAPGVHELALDGSSELRLSVRGARPTAEQKANGDPRSLGAFVRSIELQGDDGSWRSLDLASAVVSGEAGLSRDRFRLTLNRGVVRHADAFLVHSDWMGEQVLESRNQPTPIARVHHGAERRWREGDRRTARPEGRRDAFVIASLGALQAHKRIDVVLRALARARERCPDIELVCAGEARPAEVDHVVKSQAKSMPVRPIGRPKLNPHAQEKKMSIRMPAELHRQLRLASADTGRPMTEIAVDALIKHLRKYEGK